MKRKALFIGVNEYEDRQIRNLNYSLSDAHALKTLFELFGYETDVLENPCKSDVFRAVKGMTEDLSEGDLFFFYFAGHGWTTVSGRHLLFCKDDRYEYLRYDYNTGIPFDFLKKLTETGGYNRAFVLDACRSDFIAGTRGEDATTRDLRPIWELVKDAPARSSLAVLRSCSQYEHALEIDSRKHGLFTLAMMDVLRASREAGEELLFGEPLCDAITDKMLCIANEVGIAAAQTPEFAKSGAAQVLVAGRKAVAPAANGGGAQRKESDAKNPGRRPEKSAGQPAQYQAKKCDGEVFLEYAVLRDYRSMLRNCGMDDAITKMNGLVRYMRKRDVWHVLRTDAFLEFLGSMPAFADVVQEKNMARAPRLNLKCWFDNKGWPDSARIANLKTRYDESEFAVLDAIYGSITRSNQEI